MDIKKTMKMHVHNHTDNRFSKHKSIVHSTWHIKKSWPGLEIRKQHTRACACA
jgi:hypothetical protein